MNIPPGWYTDPQSVQHLRWWDGTAWTAHVTPISPPQAAPVVPTQRAPERPAEILERHIADLRAEYDQLLAQVVETREMVLLQEVGIYEYSHPLDSAAQYKEALDALQREIQACIKAGNGVTGTKKWAINGSEKDGAKMVGDFCKLMLRAYNSEADNTVRTLKHYTLKPAIERLQKMRASISKLGSSMKIEITDSYHALRVRELELTADYLVKVAEEKEQQRDERARLKEAEAALRDFEREQSRLEKERSHYEAALRALQARGDTVAAEATALKLEEIQSAIDGVVARAANARAGYVYVISNIGSFGGEVVKIGLTRRLEPMDRVRELGDASVPFRFDVHALIFSDDAVALETELHRHFAKRRVNLVNAHREFFYATPHEVKEILLELRGSLLSFTEVPEALEWHQSMTARKHL
jgi:hypothetical protein